MVVARLWGANIPVYPVSEHNLVLSVWSKHLVLFLRREHRVSASLSGSETQTHSKVHAHSNLKA